MNSLRYPFATLAVFATVLSATASAQVTPATYIRPSIAQSMLTGSPLGLQIQVPDSAGDPSAHQVGIRSDGLPNRDVSEWDATRFQASSEFHPDYSQKELFAHWVTVALQLTGQWSASLPGHVPALGDFSTGGDITPAVDAQGRLQTVSGIVDSWFYLSFAVQDPSSGQADGLFDEFLTQVGTLEGAIFGYASDGNTGVPGDYDDVLRVDYTRGQITPSQATEDWSISGLDWGMGQISRTPGLTSGTSTFPERQLFYFSIAQSWIDDFSPGPILDANSMPLTLDSGTIYYMEWGSDGQGGFEWSAPSVAWSHQELYGQQESGVEIDALSVYVGNGTPEDPARVVFSLTQDSQFSSGSSLVNNPFLVSQTASPPVFALPLRTVNDDLFSAKIQIDPITGPDPHGFCGFDPAEGSVLPSTVGVPTAASLQDPDLAQLGLSMRRLNTPGTKKDWDLTMEATGCDDHGWVIGVALFELWLTGDNGSSGYGNHSYIFDPTSEDVPTWNFTLDTSTLGGVTTRVDSRVQLGGIDEDGNFVYQGPLIADSWLGSLAFYTAP